MKVNVSSFRSFGQYFSKNIAKIASVIGILVLAGCGNNLQGERGSHQLTDYENLIVYSVGQDEKVTVAGELGKELSDDATSTTDFLTVEIRLPKTERGYKIRDALNAAKEGGTKDTYDLLVIARGSVHGARCHDRNGDEHCHPNY